jgi:3-oxoacyl-[acyl-carrier-protein] synthase II
MLPMRRVVITGIGLTTPLANGAELTWKKLLNGESGIRAITHFDVSDIPAKIAGVVPVGTGAPGDFNSEDYVTLKDQRRMDRFIVFALAAAHQAIADSGWVPQNDEEREASGVMVGSGIGGLPQIHDTSLILHEGGPRRVSPFFIPASLINLASGHIAITHGYKGPNHSVVTACATGVHAIGDAARLIQWGDADVMVAGGAEAAVCRIGLSGFAAARALSTHYNETPTQASRPWDKDRDGFVMGEGAGIVVLEDYDHAVKRGAKIYGEIIGYGLSGDAYHVTAPAEDGDGAYRAMRNALKRAQINPEDIDYINAHGTSTPLGDVVELRAIRRLFEGHIKKMSVSSTKSAIGHLLGAGGSVEAIFTLLALRDQIVPPTLNLHSPDPESEGFDLVPHKAKERQVRVVMSNSFGFGGTNASLIMRSV